MKRLSMLGMVLVVLALMVSSASAHVVQKSPGYSHISAGGTASTEHVIVFPLDLPDDKTGFPNPVVIDPPAAPDSGKATPILF